MESFLPILIFLDCSSEEPLIHNASYPIGKGRRRDAADVLGISMSGFPVPQFVFLERSGRCRARYSVRDEFCRHTPANSRKLIADLVHEEGQRPC